MPDITSAPPDDLDLGRLFRRWDRFESLKDWKRAGFQPLREKEGKIFVLRHEDIDRYLFKKYGSRNERSADEQLENYQYRVAGSALLRGHIVRSNLRHVVASKKWLCELPAEPGARGEGKSPHVLVVERQMILGPEESQDRYRHLDAETARELCTLLFAFRGLDMTEFPSRNAPFTREGTIAFIDTEHVRIGSKKLRSRRRYYQKYVDVLFSKHRRLADDMWRQLAQGANLR